MVWKADALVAYRERESITSARVAMDPTNTSLQSRINRSKATTSHIISHHIRNMARGKLIVFEGLDRSGKSTQCQTLVDDLQKDGIKVRHMRFPGKWLCTEEHSAICELSLDNTRRETDRSNR